MIGVTCKKLHMAHNMKYTPGANYSCSALHRICMFTERVDHLDVIDDNVQTSEYPSFGLISNLDRIEDFDTPYDLDSITHHHAMVSNECPML